MGIFQWTSLPEKDDFYIHLNKKGITDADYMHAKKVCKEIEITSRKLKMGEK